jgi:PKD domain
MTFSRSNIEPVAAIKAVAGINTVAVNKPVGLTAAPSYDPNGGRLTYLWMVTSMPSGSNAALTSNGSVLSAFTPDLAGSYEVMLRVTNAAGSIATDKIQLIIGSGLVKANAGPDVSTQVGTPIFVDPFRSIQTAGKELTATWKILSALISSTAILTNYPRHYASSRRANQSNSIIAEDTNVCI